APSSPKDEVAVATGLARPLSSAVKQQYDQRNEHERDEQDYQPPLSRRQQTGAGLIPGGNDPGAVVCQLHRIFVELTLSGRHLVKRRELLLSRHAQLCRRFENSRASRARRHRARFPQRRNLPQRRRLLVLKRQTSARSTVTDRVLCRLVENLTPIQPDGK